MTARKTRTHLNAASKANVTRQFRAMRRDGISTTAAMATLALRFDVAVGTIRNIIQKETGSTPATVRVRRKAQAVKQPDMIEPVDVVSSEEPEDEDAEREARNVIKEAMCVSFLSGTMGWDFAEEEIQGARTVLELTAEGILQQG